ncbi:DUF1616 domain-containing protein [Halosolutus amylolyticus]|uniref:DUF1616 domain-containing protein n=1 Tax=Halosolutus amylolyticus TaxID=2932267 RepID=A0ABD5PMV1_9EURY|nr:DUF1616 domain-containing protein [Halosolutus amylolyticus]
MKDVLTKPFAALQRRGRQLLGGVPGDLLVVAGFVLVAMVVLGVGSVSSSLVRAAIAGPLLFFVPGYVLVSLCFPRSTPVTATATDRPTLFVQTRSIDDAGRVALSFGTSFALLPLLGLVVASTPWGVTDGTVLGVIGGLALVGTCLAIGRRLAVPSVDRYHVGFARRFDAARAAIFETRSPVHTAINVAIVLSMILAVTTVGYALVAPQQGEEYTNLQLLTEDESGELVAGGYPDEISPGESIPLVIAVENQEQEEMNYTVVVQEQRIEDGDVVERTELRRIDYVLTDGGTGYGEREITPVAENGTVRISVQVYQDDVPETPTQEDAYRHTYFWTAVTDGSDGATDDGADDTDDGADE